MPAGIRSLTFDFHRCFFYMSHCEPFPGFSIDALCNKSLVSLIFYSFVSTAGSVIKIFI